MSENQDCSSIQSMQIARIILWDVLHHMYAFNNVTVKYSFTEEGHPAFKITFDRNSEDMANFEEFIRDLENVEEETERFVVDSENGIIGFASIKDIPGFWDDFFMVNGWYPNTVVISEEVTSDDRFDVSTDDLKKLKSAFYWSWRECAQDIANFTDTALRPFGKFIYSIDDLERSINLRAVMANKRNYLPFEVFRVH